ncbi:MAG: DUF664 domain-containing protein [Nocardioidaceae bacterium]
MSTDDHASRELLTDSFQRIADLVVGVTDNLDAATAAYRLDAEANTVAWLVWHLSRIQDDHVGDLAGSEQAWTSAGWHERLELPFEVADTGYGHTPEQVAEVQVAAELIAGYHADVHRRTLAYVRSIDGSELSRVVDDSWNPPVTAGARLVSVIGDALQHLGQAAYVRGVAERSISS